MCVTYMRYIKIDLDDRDYDKLEKLKGEYDLSWKQMIMIVTEFSPRSLERLFR